MAMSKAALAARKAYAKKWKQKNPEKVKKNTEDYWERVAKKLQDISK